MGALSVCTEIDLQLKKIVSGWGNQGAREQLAAAILGVSHLTLRWGMHANIVCHSRCGHAV